MTDGAVVGKERHANVHSQYRTCTKFGKFGLRAITRCSGSRKYSRREGAGLLPEPSVTRARLRKYSRERHCGRRPAGGRGRGVWRGRARASESRLGCEVRLFGHSICVSARMSVILFGGGTNSRSQTHDHRQVGGKHEKVQFTRNRKVLLCTGRVPPTLTWGNVAWGDICELF